MLTGANAIFPVMSADGVKSPLIPLCKGGLRGISAPSRAYPGLSGAAFGLGDAPYLYIFTFRFEQKNAPAV